MAGVCHVIPHTLMCMLHLLMCMAHTGCLKVAFRLYWNMINTAYTQLMNLLSSLTRASGAATRVFPLLDATPDIDQNKGTAATQSESFFLSFFLFFPSLLYHPRESEWIHLYQLSSL